jgi:hypothetical protein
MTTSTTTHGFLPPTKELAQQTPRFILRPGRQLAGEGALALRLRTCVGGARARVLLGLELAR